MSNYTTQVRFICESYANCGESEGMMSVDEVIRRSRDKVFSFDYPIFDEAYRAELESKILSHYYTEEIGSETVGLWKHQLKNKMREIMPYYNQLYMSEKIKFDPLINSELNDTRQTTGEANRVFGSSSDKVSQANYSEDRMNDHSGTRLGENTSDGQNSYGKQSGDTSRFHGTDTEGTEYSENGSGTKTGTETLDKTGTDTHAKGGTEAVAQMGTETLSYEGKATKTDELKKEGSELTVDIPAHNLSVLHKHSDTPLGGIDGVTDGSQIPAISGGGSGAVDNYSNYLSDVSEDVTNFDKNPAVGQNSARKRNHAYTRYGKWFNPNTASSGADVESDVRKDTHTVVEDFTDSTHQRRDVTSHNRTDTTTFNTTDTETVALKDKTTFDTATTDDKTGSKNVDASHTNITENTGNESGSDTSHNVSVANESDNAHDRGKTDGTRTQTDSENINSDEKNTENKDYFGRLFGKTGSVSYSKLLMEYRQTFLNIDMDIINDLQPLFMGIW